MSNSVLTDEDLLRLLEQDASLSSEKVAKKLNVSAPVVRRRIRKLIQAGALRIIGTTDPEKLGFSLAAVIALNVASDKLNEAMNELIKYPEIRWMSSVTGRFDIILMARFRSTTELSDFVTNKLSQTCGVKNSETLICLNIKNASVNNPLV